MLGKRGVASRRFYGDEASSFGLSLLCSKAPIGTLPDPDRVSFAPVQRTLT